MSVVSLHIESTDSMIWLGISICLLVAFLLVVLAFVIATCTTKHNPFNFDLHLATLIFYMLFRDIYSKKHCRHTTRRSRLHSGGMLASFPGRLPVARASHT